MSTISQLVEALERIPALHNSVQLNQLVVFIDLCRQVRPDLDLEPTFNPALPPHALPQRFHVFLAEAIFSTSGQESLNTISSLWKALSRLIWDLGPGCIPALLPLFLKYGIRHKIGKPNCIFKYYFNITVAYYTIGPPVTSCRTGGCSLEGQALSRRKWYPATLFTKDLGPVPIFPCNLYCESELLSPCLCMH
jgi:hypothetical protein